MASVNSGYIGVIFFRIAAKSWEMVPNDMKC